MSRHAQPRDVCAFFTLDSHTSCLDSTRRELVKWKRQANGKDWRRIIWAHVPENGIRRPHMCYPVESSTPPRYDSHWMTVENTLIKCERDRGAIDRKMEGISK